jgi:hypothetical protein
MSQLAPIRSTAEFRLIQAGRRPDRSMTPGGEATGACFD